MRVYRSKEFKNWYVALSPREKRVIDSRVDTYKKDGLLLKAAEAKNIIIKAIIGIQKKEKKRGKK